MAIPPEHVSRVWNLAEPLLALATDLTPKTDTGFIEQKLHLGDAQLWMAVAVDASAVYAALVSEVLTYDSGWKVMSVFACGGRRLWLWKQAADDAITAFAIAERCDAVEIVGKEFWENVFPGFERDVTVFSKRLEVRHD